ncbi:alpha/beta fold hydrolase [Pseudohaliea rubra]|uniref:Esterase ybfF n=1 Tax=Pseudohaliea rubra DSM 19751 TaxID=1265313 RepID=A0A095VUN4_9GAMM|nr:alpha/beta fold hydrolase [Pseudohaliea rubra]KGE05137.1 Esterase ybfF [Pseudohaliea rubra DSM 19751]
MTPTTLHAASVGDDGPPVLLLHGLFGMGSNLGALARALADSYRVYSLDLPDHGRSAWTDASDLPRMAEAVHAWMRGGNIERAHVVGHSLGGKVAMQLALADAAAVASLVVADIAPVAYAGSHEAVFAALAAVDAAAVRSRKEAGEILRRYLEEEGVVQFLLLSLAHEESGAWHWRFNRTGLESNYSAYLAAPAATGPYPGPVLFLRGGRSPYVRDAHLAEIRRRFPAARLETIHDCGHWLHAEEPETFNSLVRGFIDDGAEAAR